MPYIFNYRKDMEFFKKITTETKDPGDLTGFLTQLIF